MSDIKTCYLLVGFSVAGWWCARTIREKDKENKIVAVTKDNNLYSPPLITYFLGKKVDSIGYSPQWLTNLKVELVCGEVKKLDRKNNRFILSNGESIVFEKALITTGGLPIVPPIPNQETNGVFTLTTQQDMQKVSEFVKSQKAERVTILGGGFIGIKTAEAFMELGLKVTIVELSNRLLQNMLDEKGSYYLEEAFKRAGVEVLKENTITEFQAKDGKLVGASLKSGKYLPGNLAVIAIGVRPNLDLLVDSGIKVNRGIIVDEFQQSQRPSIFAAGDVAETKNLITGERNIVAVWPEAVKQGKIAGMNMAGNRVSYPGSLPVNSVSVGETTLVAAGLANPPSGDFEFLTEVANNCYQKLVLKDDYLVGMVLVNKIEKAGIYINLIRQKSKVKSFKDRLLRKDFGMVNLPSEYRKHLVEGASIEV